MKKVIIQSMILSAVILLANCGKGFLEKVPQGQLFDEQIVSSDGVEAILLGAYGIMNGNISGTWGNYGAAPSQWLFGEVTSDNAHKGSNEGDQPAMNLLEALNTGPTNDQLFSTWQTYYEGIVRCNNTLNLLKEEQETVGEISDERAIEIQAEARMLRGHYYFFLWRIFKNLPYIDENTSREDAERMPNDTDIYDKIIEDVQFAVDNLPTQKINGEVGRMDKTIATAYLGKLYLYQNRHDLALPLFEEVISGKDLRTMPFQNNFDVDTEDGPETVLVAKHAINPNGTGDNANVGDMLSGAYGSSPVGCCGFYQPTFDLVNAYKVTEDGLPYLDREYRSDPYLSDFGLPEAQKANYQVSRILRFDPRLDYTVGRRGVPFLDYGIMPGDSWIRDASFGGPFIGMKTMIRTTQFAANAVAGENYITGLDVNIIRLADVILMAAECAVEQNDLEKARSYVNMVRERANNLPRKQVGGTNIADYRVSPYPAFPDQTYARKAVQMERRLELAMEGHRFFDLVRWGIAKEVLESYSTFEGSHISFYRGLVYKPHSDYFPIPQGQIDRSGGTLSQNTGY